MTSTRPGNRCTDFRPLRSRGRINRSIAGIDALEPRRLLSSAESELFVPQMGYTMTDHFGGSIDATITGSSITFDSASLVAVPTGYPSLPRHIPADFAVQTSPVQQDNSITGLVSTITSSAIPLSDDDTFAASGLTIADTSGTLTYANDPGGRVYRERRAGSETRDGAEKPP
jgi:hypothetical protein